jgi:hypothetical protein
LDSRNEHRFRDRGLVLHFQDRQDGDNGPEELREKQTHPGVPIFQLRAQGFVPDLHSLCRILYLGLANRIPLLAGLRTFPLTWKSD